MNASLTDLVLIFNRDHGFSIPLISALDLVNHLCLLTLDGELGIAPPCREDAKVGRVLDVGTGTGIWAVQFGDDHPEADILGIDLSATQPSRCVSN